MNYLLSTIVDNKNESHANKTHIQCGFIYNKLCLKTEIICFTVYKLLRVVTLWKLVTMRMDICGRDFAIVEISFLDLVGCMNACIL